MDVPRHGIARKKRIRRIIYGSVILVAVLLITLGLSRLEPAAPSVERATVWIDTVKRGSMLRNVRGNGTLVPEDIRWIPARTQGRVERILVLPGAEVTPSTVILELSNPELEQQVQNAENQWKAAEADYTNLRVQLQNQLLNEQSSFATTQADFEQAKLQEEREVELGKLGLTPDLNVKIAQAQAKAAGTRHEMGKKRLASFEEAIQAQMAAQKARVDQAEAQYELLRSQLGALRVRPGMNGVLQQVPVEVGQQVAPGTNLAQVSNPNQLKAELQVPETQAKDIQLGQSATVDTRNGIIPGRVVRIDPAATQGTVMVDVALLVNELPSGARPNLNVEGIIELERLEDVLYVGRPAFGQSNSEVGLFKLLEDGSTAVRTRVKLGRSSVTSMEVMEGLQEGDQVILSDTSQWDAFDRIRLN